MNLTLNYHKYFLHKQYQIIFLFLTKKFLFMSIFTFHHLINKITNIHKNILKWILIFKLELIIVILIIIKKLFQIVIWLYLFIMWLFCHVWYQKCLFYLHLYYVNPITKHTILIIFLFFIFFICSYHNKIYNQIIHYHLINHIFQLHFYLLIIVQLWYYYFVIFEFIHQYIS